MNNDRTIPTDVKHGFVSFDVIADGSPVSPDMQIFSVTVNREANRIPTAKLIIRDGDAATEDFEISNLKDFEPGSSLEIKSGRDGDNTSIFKGIVIRHRIKIGEKGASLLIVEAKEDPVKMTVGRHNKYFTDSTDSDIMGEILGEYGLAGDVESTDVTHAEVVQYYSTDWDFLLSRAETNGKLVFVNEGKVDVKKPDTSSEPVLTLIYGSTLLDFEAETDARTQYKVIKGKAWDYAGQTLFETESSSADFKENGNIAGDKLSDVIGLSEFELQHSGQVLTEELQAWTDACMLKSRLAKIRGKARFFGSPEVVPGAMVKLQGVGDRFNGNVYITAVRHELINGNWFTHAQFGLSPEWCSKKEDVIDTPAAGLLPGINGLQVGKVVQLQDDPDGEDRILVKAPIIDNDARGIWARIATLDAGENRGSFFRPEIEDEVILGFINDDPRDPVVLGMMNSSAKPAPLPGSDDNHEKAFVTRSDMRIHFNDDTKVLTISTPAGNSIELSEDNTSITVKDQNNNKVVLDSSGILLDSPKDINIKALGNIALNATQNLDITALNITLKAQAQLGISGGAGTLDLTPAGADLKGPMVKIN